MKHRYIYIGLLVSVLSFQLGLVVSSELRAKRANRVVQVIDNPNCLTGRMK